MLSELKDWTVSLVIQNNQFTENALVSLAIVSFTESSFFPIPPDIPFILMGVLRPESAYLLATILTVSSVVGGALGYFIGLYGGRPFVTWLVNSNWTKWIFSQEKFDKVEGLYNKYDVWVVLAAAFTPIPYKVFTIAGGLCRIPFWRFMLVSLIGRAGRFYLVGTVLYFFGEQAKPLLSRFDLFLAAMLVLLVLGFVSLKFIGPQKRLEPPVE